MALTIQVNQLRDRIEENLKTLSPARKILVLALTVALIGGGYWYFGYQKTVQKIDNLNRDTENLHKRIAKLKMTKRNYEKFQEQIAMLESEFEEISRYFPQAKEIPALLYQITQLRSDSGLQQLLFEPEKEEIRDFYAVIGIKLRLAGSYHNFGIFFTKLANLPRVIRVKSLEMTRQKSKAQSRHLLEVRTTLETYRFLTPEEIERVKATSKGKKKRKR